MLKFPYGISNFDELIREGYVYVDRTDRIPLLEEAGKYLFFLRPRRYGKSLLLSLLESYYDVALADNFEELFGHLAIGANPTALRNSYMVMRWDFSRVGIGETAAEIRDAMYSHINARIQRFALKYDAYLKTPISISADAMASFDQMLAAVQYSGYSLFLFIDEYDNFANEVMMTRNGQNQSRYDALVSGEGLIKTVFKNLKAATSGDGLERIFVTGVSPLVLSDTTSGFNVSVDMSLRAELNDLCGFGHNEVHALLQEVCQQCKLPEPKVDEAHEMMRLFYDGSCFTTVDDSARVYNPTLVLYFLQELQRTCAYPDNMLDKNLATDKNKLAYISEGLGGDKLLEDAVDEGTEITLQSIEYDFTLAEMVSKSQRQDRMISLIYHLGILTLDGRNEYGQLKLAVPNLAIRQLCTEHLLSINSKYREVV